MARLWQDIEVQREATRSAARLGSERSGSARAWQWVGHIVVSKIDVDQFDVLWDPLGYGGIPAMLMFKDAELEPHLARRAPKGLHRCAKTVAPEPYTPNVTTAAFPPRHVTESRF